MKPVTVTDIPAAIAKEIGCSRPQVEAAVALLDGGATVPFVARYRKEATGGLDDAQLRLLEGRLSYLRELASRKEAVFRSIEEQGKMTDAVAAAIAGAATKAEVEDVYLPFRPKRRTKAQIAIEKGLGALAESLLADRSADPETLAASFVNGEVPDVKAALDGARDVLSERFAEDPATAGEVRTFVREKGRLKARVVEGKEAEAAKFSDYFDHDEDFSRAAGHRVLAMLRAREQGFLTLDVETEKDPSSKFSAEERIVMRRAGFTERDAWLAGVAKWTWRVKLGHRIVSDLISEAREKAEAEAIAVFARNLKALLMAAPAGSKTVLGLDPGVRTGVKAAVVDGTGRLVDMATFYPFQPRNDVAGSVEEIRRLVRKHGVEIVAVGNGTASRETDALVAKALEGLSPKPARAVVSEAGASVYSASALASEELPGVDVTIRGAVSIARRLQDPLAELVKIEPKSIGVGQYQHDVDQSELAKALDASVEDAVNAVGVDLNTASPSLLSRVSGIGPSLAASIVSHRDANGRFTSRAKVTAVPGLGPKAFEQCAGFLRVTGGEEPLDASAVHPEAYPVARRIVDACGGDVAAVMKDPSVLKKVRAQDFVDGRFGLPTVKDILAELAKPGRDPRPAFRTAVFDDAVREMKDLKPGMRLEGTVTNVAAFGAFVDVGVHQDGLVHVSEIADRFVRDPSEVVKAGDTVKVTVTGVDIPRKRISLSMKSSPVIGGEPGGRERGTGGGRQSKKPEPAPKGRGGFGDALVAALDRREGGRR